MKKKTRYWYAIQHSSIPESNHVHHVHRFKAQGLRHAFIARNAPKGTTCEIAAATDPIVRRAIRYAGTGVSWPVPILKHEDPEPQLVSMHAP